MIFDKCRVYSYYFSNPKDHEREEDSTSGVVPALWKTPQKPEKNEEGVKLSLS